MKINSDIQDVITYNFWDLESQHETDKYIKQRIVMRAYHIFKNFGKSLKEVWEQVKLHFYLIENPEHTCSQLVISSKYYGENKYLGD